MKNEGQEVASLNLLVREQANLIEKVTFKQIIKIKCQYTR